MQQDIVLASGSQVRAEMLRAAGVAFRVRPAPIDEDALRVALEDDGAAPRDMADALAEAKARRIGRKEPGALVLGCDQVLVHDGRVLTKPDTRAAAEAQLRTLSGHEHRLYSAAVIYEDAEPVWRHVAEVRLWMHQLSDPFLVGYLDRNWPAVQGCVGGYQLEAEGARLFSRVAGDYFAVLGLPLVQLLTFLTQRGSLDI